MDAVAVISASGKPLMPTNPMRARKLIKKGKAVIYKYRPLFTIRLTERTDGDIQTIEYCCDTGYQHIGLSIKSRKHEYVNINVNIKMYIFDHLRMYIFAILPLDRYIFLSDKIFP